LCWLLTRVAALPSICCRASFGAVVFSAADAADIVPAVLITYQVAVVHFCPSRLRVRSSFLFGFAPAEMGYISFGPFTGRTYDAAYNLTADAEYISLTPFIYYIVDRVRFYRHTFIAFRNDKFDRFFALFACRNVVAHGLISPSLCLRFLVVLLHRGALPVVF